MSKRMYEDLKDTLNSELRALAKKGELNRDSLDSIYKLTETIKSLDKIMMAEERGNSSEPGYSMTPMMSYGMTSGNQSMRGSYDGSYNRGSYEGGSNRGSYEGSYERGGSNRGSYDGYDGRGSNDGSYARRGRDADSDGRYSEYGNSRDYSRHTSKERMIEKLTMMMNEASTEKEREAIRRCMEQLEY